MRIINTDAFNAGFASATRIARINCGGKVHDHDWWSDSPEEESFDWSDSIRLENGGFTRECEQHKTVDGEVTLKLSIKLMVASDGNMYISGNAELREGGIWSTVDDTEKFDLAQIPPGKTVTLLDKRLSNSGGDWATVKLEIKNDEG